MGQYAGDGDALAGSERRLDDGACIDLVAVRDVGQNEPCVSIEVESRKALEDACVEGGLGRRIDPAPRREVVGPQRALVSVGTV